MTVSKFMNKEEQIHYYKELIDNMICGYALHEAVYNEDGVFVDYTYIDINNKYEELLNVKKENIKGKSVTEVFPNTESHWMTLFANVVKTGEPVVYEDYHIDSKKYYQVNVWRPKENMFSLTFFDITDKKEQLSDLKKSEERYRGLVESQDSLVVRIDMDGKLILVNEAYCDKFGEKRENIIGTHFAPKIHPDDKESTTETVKKLFSPPYRSHMIQRAWTPQGWRWISWEDCMILDENSVPIEIQAVGYDVSDLKENQVELLRSNQDLENFAYVASHDLQEPLRKITAFDDLLTENIKESGGIVNDESKFYLKKISEAAFRMKNMIDDLLNYSRISMKGKPFVICDIRKVIEDLLENELEEKVKKIEMEIKIEDNVKPVACDPSQIKQLFQNLLSNSIKFKDKNRKLVIGISCEKSESKKECTLMLSDNGIGFDNKYSDKIFRSFSKLHSKDDYPGSGIGLAICKRIIERHKWKISASGEEGKGSIFGISFPCTNGECCYGTRREEGDIDCG